MAEKERNHALGGGGGLGGTMPPAAPNPNGHGIEGVGGGYGSNNSSNNGHNRNTSNGSLGSMGGYGSGGSGSSGGGGGFPQESGMGSRNTSMDASAVDAGMNLLSMKLAQDEMGGGVVKGMSLPSAANNGWGEDDDLDFNDSPAQKPIGGGRVGTLGGASRGNDDMGSLMSDGFSSGGGARSGMSLSQGGGNGAYGAPTTTSYAPPRQASVDPFADIGLPTGPAVITSVASPTKKGRVRGQKLTPKKEDGDWDDF